MGSGERASYKYQVRIPAIETPAVTSNSTMCPGRGIRVPQKTYGFFRSVECLVSQIIGISD